MYFSGLISETKQNYITPTDVKAKQLNFKN